MSAPTILLVHPGATFSTHDVWVGLRDGLTAQGCRVVSFRLDVNLDFMARVVDLAIAHEVLAAPVDPFKMACRGLGDMAIHMEPDAVIVVSGGNLRAEAVITLRELAAQRKRPFPVAVYCTESPYFGEVEGRMARFYDVCFTNERSAVAFLADYCPRVAYLPHAYNPAIHTPGLAEPDKACDVFFVGTGFPERRALFDGVCWDGIAFTCLGYGWDGWEVGDTRAPQHVTPNEEVVRYYRAAAICLNHHRTTTTLEAGTHIPPGAAVSLNPRAYEIAACGAFQLMDDSRAEASEIFGSWMPTYRHGDSGDLERAIRHWLARPALREEYAAAQRAAILPHSWTARAGDILNLLLG
jgi:spore maturation protein CgeB